MMRVAERSCGNERAFISEQSSNAMNLRRVDCFLERHWWNDGGNTFRKHRFTGTGRPDHQDVVTAGHRHFDSAFDVSLAFHVAKIDVVRLMRGKESGQISTRRQKRSSATQTSKCMPHTLNPVDLSLSVTCGFKRM